MSFHHLDAPEYQGPGVTQLHDTAIEAELVTAPERPVPDDVLHYNKQLQLEQDKQRKKQPHRLDDDDSSQDEEEEEEEDDELMQQMRQQILSRLKQQHDAHITAATTASASPHLHDIVEDEFAHHCLASSHSHLTLLLLHCNTPACVHMSHVLVSVAARYTSTVRCVRLRATGDNIAHFPLAACPTTMAYRAGRKVGQWGGREWKRGVKAEQVQVSDVVRELRRCGLLEAAEDTADDEEEESNGRSERLRVTRSTAGAKGQRRAHDDSSDEDG